MTVAEVLKAAREIVAKPDGWHKGTWSFDGGTCFCSLGAISHVCAPDVPPGDYWFDGDADEVGHLAASVLCEAEGLAGIYCDSVPEWNDDEDRTQPEVVAAFDKAIALAEAQQ